MLRWTLGIILVLACSICALAWARVEYNGSRIQRNEDRVEDIYKALNDHLRADSETTAAILVRLNTLDKQQDGMSADLKSLTQDMRRLVEHLQPGR